MPKFSQESFSKLSTCHIDLQAVFFEVVKTLDCEILVGHRGEQEQNDAFQSGKSKLDWPNGKHNSIPSMAVDVAPCPIDWGNTNEFIYFAGFVEGVSQRLKDEGKITHSLRWGGNWKMKMEILKQEFNDFCHFELV